MVLAVSALSRRHCLLCAVAAASHAACGIVLEGEPLVKGRSVWVYGTMPSSQQLTSADDYIDRCARFLGVSLPTPIEYLWRPEPSGRTNCQGSGVATILTNTIEAVNFPHFHEIAHVLTARGGLPPLFFVEGMAEALSPQADFVCDGSAQRPQRAPLSWIQSAVFRQALDPLLLFQSRWPITDTPYVIAAMFTLTAIRAVGFERYWRFYCATPHFAEPLETERSFRAHTGATLDAIFSLLAQPQPRLSPLLP